MSDYASHFVRQSTCEDAVKLALLSKDVYPVSPYTEAELLAQIRTFSLGHFVAEGINNEIIGMSACLLICDADYSLTSSWTTMTAAGMISNHDSARGDVLYSVDTLVLPRLRRAGVGRNLIKHRIWLAQRLGIRTIRGGARISGFGAVADSLTAGEYVDQVVAGTRTDPTLSFILTLGFRVRAVATNYLDNDPPSLGYAAIVEYLPSFRKERVQQ